MAIWAQSFLVYIGNRLRYHKRLEKVDSLGSALVIGDAQMIGELRNLLLKYHPNGKHEFVEGGESLLPEGHLAIGVNLQDYDTVVYDTGHYSYGTVLGLLEKTPGNTLRLATYSSRTKVLITDSKIYR